jgi:hypothetical protein
VAGHAIHRFCDDAQYNPRFRREQSREVASPNWVVRCLYGERVDPQPVNLTAMRASHPDVEHPGLPDLLTVGSLPVVCDAFRQIVQELEPGKHQFIPIALYDEAEHPLPGTYWVMNVLEVRDCLISPDQIRKWDAARQAMPEMAEFWRPRYTGGSMKERAALDLSRPEDRVPSLKVVYVDRSCIGGLHLWRPKRHMYWIDFFLSDELIQRVENAKLRKLRVTPVVEMSVPRPQ